MMQQTSLNSYFFYFEKLQKREEEVLKVIKKAPNGITNNEISAYLGLKINQITGRTNGLFKKGLVKINEKRPDLYTGNTSIAWYFPQET
jgi:Mn-dependent DtxR family transcriptional regulator